MEAYSHTGDSRAVRTKGYYSWPHGWASRTQCGQKGGWQKRTHTVCFHLGFKIGKTHCGLRNQDSSYPWSGLTTMGARGHFGGGHVFLLDWMLVTWSAHLYKFIQSIQGCLSFFLCTFYSIKRKKYFSKSMTKEMSCKSLRIDFQSTICKTNAGPHQEPT